jgi:hypothetical protein
MTEPEYVEVERSPGGAAGTWWWMEGTLGPVVFCLSCQQPHLIHGDHAVAPDGKVRPSVNCTVCRGQTHIRLADWTGAPCVKE